MIRKYLCSYNAFPPEPSEWDPLWWMGGASWAIPMIPACDAILAVSLTSCLRYPPKMIPTVDVMVCTTATNDRDARLLLASMGVPFHGKHVN